MRSKVNIITFIGTLCMVFAFFGRIPFAGIGLVAAQSSTVAATTTLTDIKNKIYYVSKDGDNHDGLTWDTAWNEFDQIDWDVIVPGDIVLIDGGERGMTYKTPMTVGASGTANKPITIRASEQQLRNGSIILHGGRETPLPYCGQPEYEFQTENVNKHGLVFSDQSWIVFDGGAWGNMTITGFNAAGVYLNELTSYVTLKNIEILDNGKAFQDDAGLWYPDLPGIRLAGESIHLENLSIHDNGQDSIQSLDGDNNIENFKLHRSWLYNLRPHPIDTDVAFNNCRHTDGLQIFAGGEVRGVNISQSIIGPGFMQGIILGQTLTPNGDYAIVNQVLMQDVLFLKANGNNIMGYPNQQQENWVMDRITIYCPNTEFKCIRLGGDSHQITNSVLAKGDIYLPDGVQSTSNNCQWETGDRLVGMSIDPQFKHIDPENPFSLTEDFSVRNQACRTAGSRITSIFHFLSLVKQPPKLDR